MNGIRIRNLNLSCKHTCIYFTLLLLTHFSVDTSSSSPKNIGSNNWLTSCDNEICKNALRFAIDKQCNSKEQCLNLVSSYSSECEQCANDIIDVDYLVSVGEKQLFLCDNEIQLEIIGCQYFCRVNSYSIGKCQTNRRINQRHCKCLYDYKEATETSYSSASAYRLYTTLREHDECVNVLALLPNGDLVSASDDRKIKFWDSLNGQVKRTTQKHKFKINALAVLRNGDLVGARNEETTIRIWSQQTHKLKETLVGHRRTIYSLALLKNDYLASGSGDKTIKIWDTTHGYIQTLEGHTGAIEALAVLTNGDLASGSADRTIKIWNTTAVEFYIDGTLKRTLKGHASFICSLAVLPNGDLISGSWDTTIIIWNIKTGTVKHTLTGHTSNVLALAVLSNDLLASGSDDNTIIIWNTEDGTLKRIIKEHDGSVTALAVLPNGDFISGSSDTTIKIWKSRGRN